MESITNNLSQYLLFLGFVLIVAEVVFGFTVILLVTLGLSMIVTSALMSLGFIDEGLLEAFVAVSVIDGLLVALLWKPMKRLQKDKVPNEVKSDLIGSTFLLDTDISPNSPSQIRFSGSHWRAISDTAISRGKMVKVKKVEVGILYLEEA